MADCILVDGDQVMFLPIFTPAIVTPSPAQLKGSGPATISGKKICVSGDEKKVSAKGCLYMTPQHPIPGTGTLKIKALAGNQTASKTRTGGKAVLLSGSKYDAVFEVQAPAHQPPPGPGSPIPDSTKKYSGKGMFIPSNFKVMGT